MSDHHSLPPAPFPIPAAVSNTNRTKSRCPIATGSTLIIRRSERPPHLRPHGAGRNGVLKQHRDNDQRVSTQAAPMCHGRPIHPCPSHSSQQHTQINKKRNLPFIPSHSSHGPPIHPLPFIPAPPIHPLPFIPAPPIHPIHPLPFIPTHHSSHSSEDKKRKNQHAIVHPSWTAKQTKRRIIPFKITNKH